MILLLDAGNSRFKWAQMQGGQFPNVLSWEYDAQDRAQSVMASLVVAEAPRRMIVASVLGEDFKEQLTALAVARFGREPEFVIPDRCGYGVRMVYENPAQFGADRFAALVAARHHSQQACVVVDCGTAVTIDAMTADGEHAGGLILPGLELMRRSLIEHTARIDLAPADGDDGLFGHSTSQGVNAGTLRALVGAINSIVGDMTAHLSERSGFWIKRLITGGAGAYVLPYLAAAYDSKPYLVLQGLAIIADGKRPSK